MAAENLDEDKAKDTLRFLRKRLRPFAEIGCGVLILDHVVKSKDGGRWSRGSGAKLGRYDGVSYVAQMVTPYAPGTLGKLSLTMAKDRNGGVGPARQLIGRILFTPADQSTRVSFEEAEPLQKFRPTGVMYTIFDYVKQNPDASKNDLRSLGHKAQTVDTAIHCLVQEGYFQVGKEGQKNKYVILKPYG
jgi:hypothetical protein